MRWALLITLAGLAGCSFSARAAGDSGIPGEAAAGSDALANQTCVGTFLPICSATKPEPLLRIDSAQMFDTDNDPRCLAVPQQGGLDACALFYGDIIINNVLQARGSRPLVLAATGTIVVGAGVVDVSSKRGTPAGAGANAPACTAGTPPIISVTTAGGGGAGGSSGSSGGAGGLAATDGTGGVPGPPLPAPTVLAGGCPGQDGAGGMASGGAGGAGGGALYLVAATSITVTNSVAASGAGGTGAGQMAGGGGAGAGGLIVFEAPMVHVGGRAVANGGGGGEGGDPNQNGASGGDGHVTDTGAAPGGVTPTGGNAGGNGGAGATALNAAGGGVPDANGGGGGGGGVGFILMIGHAPDAGGMFSPIYTLR